jgi:hypothetical protein
MDEDVFPLSAVVKCGVTGCTEMANLKTCSRCKNQWYCSVAHQKDHWTEHKKVCKKLEASSVKIEADATKVKPPANPFAHLAPSKSVERYTMSNMPSDILPVYAVRKEITIRHGYNLMDKAVKELFAGFANDAYPIEESEGLFGIQMTPAYEQIDGTTRTSLGNLVYLTWLAIWKSKFTEGDPERKVFRNEIVMMILMGKLAEWFQLEVLEYAATKDGSHNAYANELLRRGMENITYDVLLMKFRWGELDETDIAFLTKTAE